LLRFASTVICLTVSVSFLLFAVNQTKAASAHQREQVASIAPVSDAAQPVKPVSHPSSSAVSLRQAVDKLAAELTSPFSGAVAEGSQWADRSAKLLLALMVYGFGLGYLARVLRVRT
jgi:hypothetical protein